MSHEIAKIADVSMFDATPVQKTEDGIVRPHVYLLAATHDPLGAMAAGYRLMGEGTPTYDLADITDEERVSAWEEAIATRLKAPMEFVNLHFFIEGVTRSFTHQMVRQRTAVFAQESMRFAVKRGLASEVALPPTIMESENAQAVWDRTMKNIEEAYDGLINAGIPAEDARALLPHATATRLNYNTNLRNLLEHAGNRLCTQAQFEWRHVFLGIMKAISAYKGPSRFPTTHRGRVLLADEQEFPYAWQFELMGKARPGTFTPICYHTGKCEFMGEHDRHCKIRERVQQNHAMGRDPKDWHLPGLIREVPGDNSSALVRVDGISPLEWMADHTSARLRPEDRDIS
jgi:flavin-dependent thymidylate synthase